MSFSSLDSGVAIPANSNYNVLTVKDSPEEYQRVRDALFRLLSKGLEFEVVYRSIQDERWRWG